MHPARPTALRRAAARHPRVADALLALAVFALAVPAVVHLDPRARAVAWALTAALVVPLAWRRRAPVVVFAVVAAAALVQWLLGLRLTADLALLVALYTVAVTRPRRDALAAAAVLEVGAVLAAVRFGPARDPFDLPGVPHRPGRRGLLGRDDGAQPARPTWARWSSGPAGSSASATSRPGSPSPPSGPGSPARCTTSWRTASPSSSPSPRPRRSPSEADPAAARDAMGQVARTGRSALAEMRRLLGVLRADPAEDRGTRAPVPGLHRLDELVDDARAAGLPVRLTVSGAARPLPSTVDATAYRVVQESLTNALRHAAEPTGVARRRCAGAPSDLVVEVSDDGARRRARPAPAGTGWPACGSGWPCSAATLTSGPAVRRAAGRSRARPAAAARATP